MIKHAWLYTYARTLIDEQFYIVQKLADFLQKNETSLHLACQKGHLPAAKALVAGGALLDVVNDVCLTNSR